MAVDTCEFKKVFPEFVDDNKYPPAQIEYWGSIAELRLNADRWGNLLTHGKYLFVAHNIALSAQAVAAANQVPGWAEGGRLQHPAAGNEPHPDHSQDARGTLARQDRQRHAARGDRLEGVRVHQPGRPAHQLGPCLLVESGLTPAVRVRPAARA